jgi:hypothetical protein
LPSEFCLAGPQKFLLIGGEELILDLLFHYHAPRRFAAIADDLL